MDHIPIEIIGNILSLGDARDSVVASTTCKKWRESWRNHLHALSFHDNNWHGHGKLHANEIEIFITKIILQTKRLQRLSICMGTRDAFSASVVIAWLMYTRGTLKRFCFDGKIFPEINILDKCDKLQKLEELVFSHFSVARVGPNYSALKSLSLCSVSISASNLSLLLANCPKLETLCLIGPNIAISDTMKLASASLKDIFLKSVNLGSNKFILEADNIRSLHLKDCTLELFDIVGKGSLRVLDIEDSRVINIGENADNLEVVDVSNFSMVCYPHLSRLSLSDHALHCASYGFCFPRLSQPSLSDNNGLHCSSSLPNLTVLELRWTVVTDLFSNWVARMLEECPRLKKLVIYGVVTGADSEAIADLTTSLLTVMKKYNHVDVEFKYQ